MADTEAWLAHIEAATPAPPECRIADSAELYQMKARFQTLRDKCDDHTQQFRNLNESSTCSLSHPVYRLLLDIL